MKINTKIITGVIFGLAITISSLQANWHIQPKITSSHGIGLPKSSMNFTKDISIEKLLATKLIAVPLKAQPGYIYDNGGSYEFMGKTILKADFVEYVEIGENIMLTYDIAVGVVLVVTIVAGGIALGPAGIVLAVVVAKKTVTKLIVNGAKTAAKNATKKGMTKNIDELVKASKNLASKAKSKSGRKGLAKSAKAGSKKIGKGLYDLAMPVKVPKSKYWASKANKCFGANKKTRVCYDTFGYPKFKSTADVNLGYTNKEFKKLLMDAKSKKTTKKDIRNYVNNEHMKRFGNGLKDQLTKGHPTYNKSLVKQLGGPKKANSIRETLEKNPNSSIPGFARHHHQDDPNLMQLIRLDQHKSNGHDGGMTVQWLSKL